MLVLATFLFNVAFTDTAEAGKFSRALNRGLHRAAEHIRKRAAEYEERQQQLAQQQQQQQQTGTQDSPRQEQAKKISVLPLGSGTAEEFGKRFSEWSSTNPAAYGKISAPQRLPNTTDKDGNKVQGCKAVYTYNDNLGTILYYEDENGNVTNVTVIAKDSLKVGSPVTNVVMHVLDSEMNLSASERIALVSASEFQNIAFIECTNRDTVVLNTERDIVSGDVSYKINRVKVE